MAKKHKKNARNFLPKPAQNLPNTGKGDNKVMRDDKMDFGGLPDIDLKKNLGCG